MISSRDEKKLITAEVGALGFVCNKKVTKNCCLMKEPK